MRFENDAMAVLTEVHSAEEQRNYTGSFCGFVLLREAAYDLSALADRLAQRWGIVPQESGMDNITVEGGESGDWLDQLLAEESVDVLTAPDIQEGNLVYEVPGAMIAVGFVAEPVPDGEASRSAAGNTEWPAATEVAAQHKAHLMIAVLPSDMAPLEAGKTYVKIISSCLEDANATGVYTSGTVLEPQAYQQETARMEQGILPMTNWIHVGVYTNESGNNAYTLGMDAFGYDEFEIFGSSRTAEELTSVLRKAAQHVLETDRPLTVENAYTTADGHRLYGSRKDGVAVEGHSYQLTY